MRLARRLALTLLLLALPALAGAQTSIYGACSTITSKGTCLAGCSINDPLANTCDCFWDNPADPDGFPQDNAFICAPGETCCWNVPCSHWTDPDDCVYGSGLIFNESTGLFEGNTCEWKSDFTCGCRAPLVPVVLPAPPVFTLFAPFDCTCPYLTVDEWKAQAERGTCAPPAADHVMTYKVKTSKGSDKFVRFGSVVLSDAFQANAPYQVTKPVALGLPANKNAEGVNDADTHREEYQVKPVKGGPVFGGLTDVRVANQCNDLLLEVGKPVSLLVPTAKSLTVPVTALDSVHHNLEHYLCYAAKPQTKLADGTKLPKFPKGTQVDVADQFQTRRYDLLKITKLCNAVDKSGSPTLLSGPDKGAAKPIAPATRLDTSAHLVCYQAKLAKKTIAQSGCGAATPGDKGTSIVPGQAKHVPLAGVYVANQFGTERLDTVSEGELCIPSQLVLAPPT
jgi:hypothetical protein